MNKSKRKDDPQSEVDENIPPPNLYNLLYENEKNSKLSNIINNLDNREVEDDLFNNKTLIENDNIFILDPKLKEQRDKRLGEQDKMYKIKKHFFLKDPYVVLEKKEMFNMEMERLKEKEYLDNCYKAEERLYNNQELTTNDLYYLFKRNFFLFTEQEKNDIIILQRYYYSLNLACIASSILLTTYIRAIMNYFKFELLRSKIFSFFALGFYGVGIYFSLRLFVDRSNVNTMSKFCLNAKERILDYNNEFLKTPYNEDEKFYKPELSIDKIFKF